MLLSTRLLILSALLGASWAQTTDSETTEAPSRTSGDSETATSTATGVTTHTFNVGANGHKFKPDTHEAEVGDIIEWVFYPTDHWVIRGDYDWPCVPYEYIDTNRKGFSSGPQPVQAITDDGPRFQVEVNDTEPIFFYCGAPESCTKWKMMGVINPSKNQTLDGWLENAKDQDFQLRPGEPWPTEGDSPSTHGGEGTSSSDDASTNDDAEAKPHGHKTLSPGAIAGIAIGSAAVVLLGGGLIYLCGRRGGFDKAYRKSFRSSAAPPGAYNVAPPVMEAQYGTPAVGTPEPWTTKSPVFGQSPPTSPQPTPGYAYQPGHTSTQESYYDPNGQQFATGQPTETPPVELPAAVDTVASPATTHNSERRPRTYSWAGEETAYKGTK